MKFICNKCRSKFEANATEREAPSHGEKREAELKGEQIAKVRCREPNCGSEDVKRIA